MRILTNNIDIDIVKKTQIPAVQRMTFLIVTLMNSLMKARNRHLMSNMYSSQQEQARTGHIEESMRPSLYFLKIHILAPFEENERTLKEVPDAPYDSQSSPEQEQLELSINGFCIFCSSRTFANAHITILSLKKELSKLVRNYEIS